MLYYFLPIWAFLLWQYIPLRGAKTLIIVEAMLLILTVYLAYWPLRLPKITTWLHWYTFFLMLYILMFTVKFGYAKLNRILALGLWMVFIAGDVWEYPVFFYDGVGWVNGFHTWHVDLWTWLSSHIHRAYVLATLLLTIKLTHIRLTVQNSLLIVACTFLGFVGLYPWSTYSPLSTLIHLVTLSLFGFIIYLGRPHL